MPRSTGHFVFMTMAKNLYVNLKRSAARILSPVLFLFAPAVLLAANFNTQGEDIVSLFEKIKTLILNPIINFLFVVATVVFMWGVIQYVIAADNTSKTEGAKKQMLWGIIGLAVMSSAWAIVRILESTLQ